MFMFVCVDIKIYFFIKFWATNIDCLVIIYNQKKKNKNIIVPNGTTYIEPSTRSLCVRQVEKHTSLLLLYIIQPL